MHIKKPSGHHKTFRILIPGKPIKTIKHEELDAINEEYRSGRITHDRALLQVQALAKKLEPKKPVSWLPENEALAEAYWHSEIRPKRDNVAPGEAKRRIFWGVRQLGATPILSSSEDQLYNALSHLKPRIKKRAAAVINAIMVWKGLGKRIRTERIVPEEPKFLTYDELMSVSVLKREWQLCIYAAFATGCRYGELFALAPFSLREEDSHVYISQQVKIVDGKPILAPTKNRKTGTAVVIHTLRWAVREWVELPQEVKMEMRRKVEPGEAFREAVFKALGRELNFHKLRHSYARCMLTRNEEQWTNLAHATLDDLRIYMRDRQDTIERHYAPWEVSTSQMKANRVRFG